MNCRVVESCITSPFTRVVMRRLPGSGTSSRVTKQGPFGEKVSHDLPRVHWPSANCHRRAETSLKATYPATYSIACPSLTEWALRPITTPNSPSKSTSASAAGSRIGSKGPARLDVNLAKHNGALGTGMPVPSAPLCFAKFTSSLAGPFDPIRLPAADAEVDFEGELGVVIGRRAHSVSEGQVMEYVAGYVAFNDVSARRWQFADGQWTRGKSCDTFSPNGPCLVTRDEVPDPGNLRITTRVNGEVMQDSTTRQFIFGVSQLIAYLSRSFTFYPGDIIATGTPPGVGFSRKPPRYLQEGDLVEIEIERVGKIANRVVRWY